MKKNENISNSVFSVIELSEMLGASKSFIYDLEKSNMISPVSKSKTARRYDWDQAEIIFHKLKDRKKNLIEKVDLKVKTFANLKGGVGKSTIASQFALTASSMGLKTLVIDLDPQAHATQSFGISPDQEKYSTIYDVLFSDLSLEETSIKVTPFLYLTPADITLSMLERKLFNENKREEKLARAIEKEKNNWDLIIVDTNPSASMMNVNAILASDELCIVTATDFLSTTGLKSMFDFLEELDEDFELPEIRIIPNLFDLRDRISQDALLTLRSSYKDLITTTTVRKNTDIREAQKIGIPIWLFKKRSNGAEDIKALTNELLENKDLPLNELENREMQI